MFATRLKELRQETPGLTQAKLAELLEVSQQAVGLWERGKNMPSHELIAAIASYFDVSIDYLLGRTDTPRSLQDEVLKDAIGSYAFSQAGQDNMSESIITPHEKALLNAYRAASERDKAIVDTVLKANMHDDKKNREKYM